MSSTDKNKIIEEYSGIFLVKHGKEVIFEYNHNNKGKGEGNSTFSNIDAMAGTPVDGTTRCLFCPIQNHVDQYRMNDGKRINDSESNKII